jgi:histone acetyltransferase (RNA polymerase elongator complex component)
MAKSGLYKPLSLEEAVEGAYRAYAVFLKNGVKVIRTGLCAAENLFCENTNYGFSYHEALGELVEGRIYYEKAAEILDKSKELFKNQTAVIKVNKSGVSKMSGQKKANKIKLMKEYSLRGIKIVADENVKEFDVIISKG